MAVTSMREKKSLLIDHYSPGDASDRNRHRRLAGLHIDDRYVVAKTVRNIEFALVLRQRDAPGALADQNVGLDLARRDIDHGDMGGVAERDEGGLAVLGHGEPDRGHVGLAHAGR